MLTTAREQQNAVWGEYLAQAAGGDQLAFAAFYDETSSMAYGLALKLLGNEADAEDVALDAYMQVWRSAAQFDASRGAALTWLLMIVRTRAIDRLRTRRPAEGEDVLEFLSADEAGSPERQLQERERAATVHGALSQLPAGLRRLLEMAYFQGLSHSEIAAGTGEPLGTVKTRIRRGLQLIRASLAGSPWALADELR